MAGRRLLLFRDLKDQTGKGNENKKQLKQFFICNLCNSIHFVTPFPSGQGAKKDHPLKEGDNRRIVWQRPASEEAKPIVTPNTKTAKIKNAQLDISHDFV